MEYLLELLQVTKVYQTGKIEIHALRGVNFGVRAGEMVAIMGASGSGKSTLLNILGCLDRPSGGDYRINGKSTGNLDRNELAALRNRELGFVFQSFHLLPRFNAMQNVELPLIYAGVEPFLRRQRVETALERVGLKDRRYHHPHELSGGQQQRVAIARALVNEPKLILADEPTGNLDSESSREIMEIFFEMNRSGITIILVTHEPEIAAMTRRVLRFRDGYLVEDQWLEQKSSYDTAR